MRWWGNDERNSGGSLGLLQPGKHRSHPACYPPPSNRGLIPCFQPSQPVQSGAHSLSTTQQTACPSPPKLSRSRLFRFLSCVIFVAQHRSTGFRQTWISRYLGQNPKDPFEAGYTTLPSAPCSGWG